MAGELPRVGVIACSRSKVLEAAPAAELYTGRLFMRARQWVIAHCDAYCILSAHHGVLLPDQVIEPYDRTLLLLDPDARRAWAESAGRRLVEEFGRDVEFIVFAGAPYRAALVGLRHTVPLAGLGIGQQVAKLNEMLREGGCEDV